MGNKPSVSEGEDEEERVPISYANSRTTQGTELPNGGAEDVDDEVELPPPMKPIQEPILVAAGQPPVTVIEENPCKRVSNTKTINICKKNRVFTKSNQTFIIFDFKICIW